MLCAPPPAHEALVRCRESYDHTVSTNPVSLMRPSRVIRAASALRGRSHAPTPLPARPGRPPNQARTRVDPAPMGPARPEEETESLPAAIRDGCRFVLDRLRETRCRLRRKRAALAARLSLEPLL